MFKLKKLGILSGTLVSFALLIHGCGGGGSSTTPTVTPTSGTATQSSSTASKAITSALGTAAAATNSGAPNKPAFKAKAASNQSDAAQIRQALVDFKASLGTRRQKALQASTDESLPCNVSGSGNIHTDDNNTPADVTDDSLTLTATNCTNNPGGGSTSVTNGSFSITPSGNGFTMTFTDFLDRFTGNSGRFWRVLSMEPLPSPALMSIAMEKVSWKTGH